MNKAKSPMEGQHIEEDVSNAAILGSACAIEPFGGLVGGAIAGALAIIDEAKAAGDKPPAKQKQS